MMGVCDVCGNQYDKMMKINVDGSEKKFDCFECAIHALAPKCEHCQVRILGHGLEENGQFYCCASCARMSGHPKFIDRIQENTSSSLS